MASPGKFSRKNVRPFADNASVVSGGVSGKSLAGVYEIIPYAGVHDSVGRWTKRRIRGITKNRT